jgi:hypothetical protein
MAPTHLVLVDQDCEKRSKDLLLEYLVVWCGGLHNGGLHVESHAVVVFAAGQHRCVRRALRVLDIAGDPARIEFFGSGMFIPDPGSGIPDPGLKRSRIRIRIKELKNF